MRFGHQGREIGYVIGPFDQARHWAKLSDYFTIKSPNWFTYRFTTRVDKQGARRQVFAVVPCKMDLANGLHRERCEIGARIFAMVYAGYKHVIHIKKQTASSALRDLGEKSGRRNI